MDKTARIRELNDALRQSFVGGKVMLTQGVNGLSDSDKMSLLAKGLRAVRRVVPQDGPAGEGQRCHRRQQVQGREQS
jgi:hypothetical protein